MKFRVMTYNIAGGRDYRCEDMKDVKVNFSACADLIAKYDSMIVGLNEVDRAHPRSGNIDLALEIGKLTGHASQFAKALVLGNNPKNRGDYGNGLLYRAPMLSCETIIVPDPEDKSEPTYYETRCIFRATVLIGGKEVDVVVTHFGLAQTEKDETMKILVPMIKERTRPMILMGDFNLHPDKPHILTLDSLLQNTFKACKDQSTITAPTRNDNPKWQPERIDYIYVSEEFSVENAFVPDERASDHFPYIADLSLD